MVFKNLIAVDGMLTEAERALLALKTRVAMERALAGHKKRTVSVLHTTFVYARTMDTYDLEPTAENMLLAQTMLYRARVLRALQTGEEVIVDTHPLAIGARHCKNSRDYTFFEEHCLPLLVNIMPGLVIQVDLDNSKQQDILDDHRRSDNEIIQVPASIMQANFNSVFAEISNEMSAVRTHYQDGDFSLIMGELSPVIQEYASRFLREAIT